MENMETFINNYKIRFIIIWSESHNREAYYPLINSDPYRSLLNGNENLVLVSMELKLEHTQISVINGETFWIYKVYEFD